MQKIACPHCGEQNYVTSPLCWACGEPMNAPARPAPEPVPAPPEPPLVAVEPVVAEPAVPEPEPIAAEPVAAVPSKQPVPEAAPAGVASTSPDSLRPPGSTGPKPAEIEAMHLREKEYVTPPVDVEETPRSAVEWLDYAWAAVASSRHVFDAALADYNRRRGKPSGAVSSFGCLVVGAVVLVLIILLLLAVVAFLRP